MLVVTRKVSESIMIGEDIEIIVTEIGAERVKIGIKAPRGIPILRKELLETRNLNREASTASCRDAVDQLKKLLEQRTVSADTTRRVVPADKSRNKLTNK